MKILTIIFILLLMIGVVSAIAFNLKDSEFTRKVTTISSEKICSKTSISLLSSVCDGLNVKGYNVSTEDISIKQNPITGVYQVKAK